VLDPGYRPVTTMEMVDEAHAAGMSVIPWGVNDIATMNRLIDIGVDRIITDYPDRLRTCSRPAVTFDRRHRRWPRGSELEAAVLRLIDRPLNLRGMRSCRGVVRYGRTPCVVR